MVPYKGEIKYKKGEPVFKFKRKKEFEKVLKPIMET